MALAAVLALSGCAPEQRNFGFVVEDVGMSQEPGGPALFVRQRITFSDEARDALVHGVPLVVRVEGRLRPQGARRYPVRVARDFELSYLPLSDHYQLRDLLRAGPGVGSDAQPRTYPRLRHALADLTEVTLPLPPHVAAFVGEDAPADALTVGARTHLAEQELPPPMRLPAWLSARWHHDSGWLTRSVPLPGQGPLQNPQRIPPADAAADPKRT